MLLFWLCSFGHDDIHGIAGKKHVFLPHEDINLWGKKKHNNNIESCFPEEKEQLPPEWQEQVSVEKD